MEFKVREAGSVQPKSKQEQEREVVKLHEEANKDNQEIKEEQVLTPEIDEEKILNFIESKHGKKFSKLEEIFQPVVQEKELPEDVEAFYKFKKETGRSLSEFIKINRDLDKLDPDSVLREYYRDSNPELSDEDIDFMIEDLSETDIDDDITIKKKAIERKKELEKAKSHLKSIADKYKAPLESREPVLSEEQRREFEAFQDYIANSKTEKEAIQKRSEWFQKKTEEVFGENFKGFEFKISEDKSAVYSPGDRTSLKTNQANISNFLSKFTNENGMIEDASGYHKALAVAMNADQFAKHFYEMGVAEALENQAKKDKNIDFSTRQTPSTFIKNGLKIRESSPSSGGKLVIKSST